jgi:hypothetical protein
MKWLQLIDRQSRNPQPLYHPNRDSGGIGRRTRPGAVATGTVVALLEKLPES